MPRTYGYLKTNADVKDLIPQIEALKSHGVADRDLYSDPAASGKGRPGLEALLGKLGRGDALVVPSIAALGSSLDEVLYTWSKVTGEAGAHVVDDDMPLLDTRATDPSQAGEPPADVAIRAIAYANDAAELIARQPQAEGIAKAQAQAQGVRFGHRRIERPDNYERVRADYLDRKIGRAEAAKLTGVSTSTFDRWIRADREAGLSS